MSILFIKNSYSEVGEGSLGQDKLQWVFEESGNKEVETINADNPLKEGGYKEEKIRMHKPRQAIERSADWQES